MKADACGFKYPEVDLSKCTDCGLCEKVCVFHEDYSVSENFSEPLAFAVRHKDYEEIRTSRSGAMFIALSDFIFSQGGWCMVLDMKKVFVWLINEWHPNWLVRS